MKVLAICLLVLSLIHGTSVSATAQQPDRIEIEGVEYSLHTNPLSSVMEARNWEPPKDAIWSSGNWRGYVARWAIRDDALVLLEVTVAIWNEEKVETSRSIIGELYDQPPPVLASWYSGALVIPEGKQVHYVHMGYGSTYERYQIFRIQGGKVLEHRSLDQAEFRAYREQKFAEWQQTPEFQAHYDSLVEKDAGDWTRDDIIDFMKGFFAEVYLAK